MKEKQDGAVELKPDELKKFINNYLHTVYARNRVTALPGITISILQKLSEWLINSKLRSGKHEKFFLGNELIQIINDVNPILLSIVKKLLSIKEGVSIDGMYQEIKPILDTLLNKKLGKFGVSLNEMGIPEEYLKEYLSEAAIKNEILPIVLILRDIPKFCKSIKDKDILGKLNHVKSQLLAHLERDVHFEVRKHLKKREDGFYTIHDNDPALVSQIKKILNAIQHAEKVLLHVNSMNLNSDSVVTLEPLLAKKKSKQVHFMTRVVWELVLKDTPFGQQVHFDYELDESERQFIGEFEETIKHAREAQSSLLEIDIPMYQVFVQELYGIGEIIQSLHTLTGPNRDEIRKKIESVDRVTQTVGDYIGKPLGVFVDQLKPHAGKTDYSFLIRHSGLLPGYLDRFTQLIRSYGAGELSAPLALEPAEAEIFKNSAINLFLELGEFDDLFLFQKGASLLFPISREVVTLGQGVYKQAQRVQDAMGDMIVYQLSRIKHDAFAHILSKSDKLEQYSGLAPGVLSKPLMQQLNKMYQTMVTYANSVIDLKEKHPDLLQLDNTSFLIQRLQYILQQKNDCDLKVKSAEEAKRAAFSFENQVKSIPNGDLAAMSTEQKSALNRDYQQFKCFVINYNPKLSVLLDQLFIEPPVAPAVSDSVAQLSVADINLMLQNVIVLCNKDMATYTHYMRLADVQLTDLPKQTQENLYALDPTKEHSILIINEPVWINGRALLESIEKPQVKHFSEKHQFAPELSAKQDSDRAKLYHDHRTRLLTLQFIHHEVELLQGQLADEGWIDNRKKLRAIIDRYRVLQPYFVDALTSQGECPIDSDCVDVFVQLTQDIKPGKLQNTLQALNTGLKKLDASLLHEEKRSAKRQLLFQFSHKKELERKTVLFGDAPLTLDSELVKRQDKWIRHQRLSTAAGAVKDTLYNLLSMFDPALNLDTVQQSTAVPFPEMENSLDALEMPSQISWIKRMLNVVHYLNCSFVSIESLDRDVSTKAASQFLKGPLVEGIYQVKPYIEMTKAYQTFMDLIQEPVGQQLFYALQDNYSTLQDVWAELGPLYTASPESVAVDNSTSVEMKGLWYPMLSLMVLPEHAKALSESRTYGGVEAKQAQQKAKEMSQYIEDVIDSFQAGQYFRLFLKSPDMLFKFLPELKGKLATFRQSTHELTLANLNNIQAVLHDALVTTDTWEIKLGLRPGSMSKPMKKILDKLFSSFIEPLGISLQARVHLVTNTISFDKRLMEIERAQKIVANVVHAENKTFEKLDNFLNLIENIKERLDLGQVISSSELALFTQQYWEIYPLLQSQQSRYEIAMDQHDKSEAIDHFCSQCLTTKLNVETASGNIHHYPQLKDILYLVKHVRAAKKGNLNTLNVRSDQLNSQALQIQYARNQDVVAAKEWLQECVHSVIDTQIEAIFKRVNQSFYLQTEYKRELYQSLRTKESDIFAKAQKLPIHEVESMVEAELQAQFDVFANQEHIQFCQLESIINSIKHFMLYCHRESSRPIYETPETLGAKRALLEHLEEIVKNDKQPLNVRLESIKEEAKKVSFRTILMAHESHFKGDLKSLIRLVINLLHPIFNFFGELQRPQDFCESLSQEITGRKPVKTRPLAFHMGLFPRAPDEPIGRHSEEVRPKPKI